MIVISVAWAGLEPGPHWQPGHVGGSLAGRKCVEGSNECGACRNECG